MDSNQDQPKEEMHKVRSEWVPKAKLSCSLPVELRSVTLIEHWFVTMHSVIINQRSSFELWTLMSRVFIGDQEAKNCSYKINK